MVTFKHKFLKTEFFIKSLGKDILHLTKISKKSGSMELNCNKSKHEF